MNQFVEMMEIVMLMNAIWTNAEKESIKFMTVNANSTAHFYLINPYVPQSVLLIEIDVLQRELIGPLLKKVNVEVETVVATDYTIQFAVLMVLLMIVVVTRDVRK